MTKLRVLFVSPIHLYPAIRGNRRRVIQLAAAFRLAGWIVDLAIGKAGAQPAAEAGFWDRIHIFGKSLPWKPSTRNARLDSWHSEIAAKEIADIAQSGQFDAVVLHYVFHSKLLEKISPQVTKVIDTHDCFSQRARLRHGPRPFLSQGFFSCSKADERAYLDRADIAIAISDDDAKRFRDLGTSAEIRVVPMAFDDVGLHTRPKQNSTTPLFGVAMSSNDVNVASLIDFVGHVDALLGQNPGFRVVVAGEIVKRLKLPYMRSRATLSRPWLTFAGVVPDIADFYSSVDGVIIPLREATGVSVKFVEAIQSGLPVLSTRSGSRGTGAQHWLHNLSSNKELVATLGEFNQDDWRALMTESTILAQTLEQKLGESFEGLNSAILAHTKSK
mgnify:CR=1 FL=1